LQKLSGLILLLLIALNTYACTIISTKSDNSNILVGRNFDWPGKSGKISFFKKADNKYAHMTIHQIGKSMPFEGINEKGLFIGQAASISKAAKAPFSFFKPITPSLTMMKIILEECQTVEEAIKKFDNYTISFGTLFGFPMIHYMIADKSGDSVIIEFKDNKIVVIRKDNPRFQIMTNFLIAQERSYQRELPKFFNRYHLALSYLEKKSDYRKEDVLQVLKDVSTNGPLDSINQGLSAIFDTDRRYSYTEIEKLLFATEYLPEHLKSLFDQSKKYTRQEITELFIKLLAEMNPPQIKTLWSAVYDITNMQVELYYDRNFDKPIKINLNKKFQNMQNQVDSFDLQTVYASLTQYTELEDLLFSSDSWQPLGKSLKIRPTWGMGSMSSNDSRYNNKQTTQIGLRLLQPASKFESAGLELTNISAESGNYLAIGIILERKQWGWLSMSIGTIGYINVGGNAENVFGYVTGLAWEPDDYEAFSPYIGLRTDNIYYNKTIVNSMISFGVSFNFRE